MSALLDPSCKPTGAMEGTIDGQAVELTLWDGADRYIGEITGDAFMSEHTDDLYIIGELRDADGAVVDEVQGMMTAAAEVVGESIDASLDLRAMVERRILDFDLKTLESIVLQVARTELRWIEVLGAVLGFVVGLVQVALLQWIGA